MNEPIIRLDDIADDAAMAAEVGDIADCKYEEGTIMHELWMLAFYSVKNMEFE